MLRTLWMYFIFPILCSCNSNQVQSLTTIDECSTFIPSKSSSNSSLLIEYVIFSYGSSFPEESLGFIWERPIDCRQTQDSNCEWNASENHLIQSNLSIVEDDEMDDILVDAACTISNDFELTQMIEPLNSLPLTGQDDSLYRIIIKQVVGLFIENDTLLEQEINRYMSEYGDSEKEQAYNQRVIFYELEIQEYYFISEDVPSDIDNNDDYLSVNDYYYQASGFFFSSSITEMQLKPIGPLETP